MLRNISLVVAYFLLSLLVSCSFSFKTEAYEQQYVVGDTGPNGGTVTSVTLESVLSDSTVELVGDFEETTYTYLHTETVVEQVTTAETVTTTTYEIVSTETTNNLVSSATKSTSGGVLDHVYSNNTGHIHTDYTGGQISFTEDLTEHLDVSEINEGITLYGQADVYACTNQIGGHCSSGNLDTFSITLKIIDTDTGEDYYKTTTWSVGHNWDTYQASFDIPSNTLGLNTQAIATFYGIDNGFWAGWYGPVIDDMRMWAVYSQLQEVITETINYVTSHITTQIQTYEYETESVYIPPVDIFDPVAEFTIEFEDSFGDTITMDFDVMETDMGGFEMEMTTMDDMGNMEIEVIEMDMEMPEMDMDMEVEVEMEVAESEPEAEQETESENKEESKEQNQETKEKIAAKIMAKVVEAGNQQALNNVKLAVMAQLTNTEGFDAYQAKALQDAQLYISEIMYGDEQLVDPYAKPYSLAQDYIMEQMINQQYGRD